MRLILFDLPTENRRNFYPLALGRPIWELRCGMTSLGEKLVAKVAATDVACFVPDYMAAAYGATTDRPVNDPATLAGDDLLLLNGRLKPEAVDTIHRAGPGSGGRDGDGELLYLWLKGPGAERVDRRSLDSVIDSASAHLAVERVDLAAWHYTWELVLANPDQITQDFAAAGRHGIEGTVEQPSAVRGSVTSLYVAPGARLHPMVVIDAENGPVYLDEGVVVHPFTRIEGPCYVGRQSVLFGTKCREGNSIGPVCRVGGEIEESIIQGYSNKYHDGFLGHAYVGQWVNLGALTTNSDLKNDYSPVKVVLDGRKPIDTGSAKVGSLIGDHTKTSIGTLLNTGAYVGAMSIVMATGKPLMKYIPEFAWLLDGVVTKGFGQRRLYEIARTAMSRRKVQWTDADESMWDEVYRLTAPQRDEAIRRGRRQQHKP